MYKWDNLPFLTEKRKENITQISTLKVVIWDENFHNHKNMLDQINQAKKQECEDVPVHYKIAGVVGSEKQINTIDPRRTVPH